MIERHWRGWTTPGDADEYERLLREDLFPSFAADLGDGLIGYRILRRDLDGEVEFCTVMRFAGMATVEAFAGEEPEAAHVPPEARELLMRFEDRVRHYEVRERRDR